MMVESVRDSVRRSMGVYAKKSKEAVNYSRSTGRDRCGNCEHFEVKAKNTCTEVIGRIEAPYWCKEYERG